MQRSESTVSRPATLAEHEAVPAGSPVPPGASLPGCPPRTAGPPLWALSLWIPAAMIGLLTNERWPWTLTLLPVALVLPLAWPVRIGRQTGLTSTV